MKRVEFPIGEVTTLAPLWLVGIIHRPIVDPRGITGNEGWTTQGLEGKAYVVVEESISDLIFQKLGQYRCRITKAKKEEDNG